MSWTKLTEKLTCLNQYFFLATQSPRKNVQHLCFIFFAVPALRSGDYTETCGIFLEKHLCRCYVLPELHKIISMLSRRCQVCDNTKPRPQTHKVSPPQPHTFNREVGVNVFEIVDSVCMRFDLECCLYGNYIRSSMDCERVRDPWFSTITYMSAIWLAWACSL